MIIDFSIANFLSIKDEQTISFKADSINENNKYFLFKPSLSYPRKDPLYLFKMNFIYGSNGSGKTNIISALEELCCLVNVSKKNKESTRDSIKPFLFDKYTQEKPSKFRISFVGPDHIIYDYDVSLNDKYIVEENLYSTSPGKGLIFNRITDPKTKIAIIDFKNKSQMKQSEKLAISNSTLWNSTVLSTYKSLNIKNEVLDNVLRWFSENLMRPVGPSTNLQEYISNRLDNKDIDKKNLIELMKQADFCLNDINFKKKKLSRKELKLIESINLMEDIPEVNKKEIIDGILNKKELFFVRKIKNKLFELNFSQESMGTQRYYELSGLLEYITLKNKTIAIDEFESSLHPELVMHFIRSFFEKSNCSQMLVTTHFREFLMEKEMFTSSNIWFCERDRNSLATEIFSLSDFSTDTIRKTSSIYNAYKIGKLGASPNL